MTSKIFTKSIWPTRTGSRSLGLQTFSLSLAPSLGERLLSYRRACRKRSKQRHRNPYLWGPYPKSLKTSCKGIQVHWFFFAWIFGFTLSVVMGNQIEIGWYLEIQPNLEGLFQNHGDPLFTHFQANKPAWELASLPPLVSVGQNSKGKENPRRIVRQEKSNVAAERKGNFQKSSQLRFRNDKTLLSQCVQYAVVWLPGFGSFREPPSCPSGIVCWYTSNVTNWLAWKKQDICTEVLMILFKPRSNKL